MVATQKRSQAYRLPQHNRKYQTKCSIHFKSFFFFPLSIGISLFGSLVLWHSPVPLYVTNIKLFTFLSKQLMGTLKKKVISDSKSQITVFYKYGNTSSSKWMISIIISQVIQQSDTAGGETRSTAVQRRTAAAITFLRH